MKKNNGKRLKQLFNELNKEIDYTRKIALATKIMEIYEATTFGGRKSG